MKNYVIDRFEGEYAVCECVCDGEFKNIARVFLPKNANEGDVITEEGSGYILNSAETAKRREKTRNLMKNLWN